MESWEYMAQCHCFHRCYVCATVDAYLESNKVFSPNKGGYLKCEVEMGSKLSEERYFVSKSLNLLNKIEVCLILCLRNPRPLRTRRMEAHLLGRNVSPCSRKVRYKPRWSRADYDYAFSQLDYYLDWAGYELRKWRGSQQIRSSNKPQLFPIFIST